LSAKEAKYFDIKYSMRGLICDVIDYSV